MARSPRAGIPKWTGSCVPEAGGIVPCQGETSRNDKGGMHMAKTLAACVIVAFVILMAGCGSGPPSVGDFEADADLALDAVTDVDLDMDGADDVIGTILTRRPRADTFIHEGYPTTNFGRKHVIRCGNYPDGYARRGLLKFDVREIPPTATVNKAFLYLYVMRVQQGPDRYRIHRVTGPWKELAVTWSASPPHSAGMSAVRTLDPSMVGTYVRWRITSLAQDWVSTPSRNFGCLVRGSEGASQRGAVFGSRQNPTASKRPKLKVDFTL